MKQLLLFGAGKSATVLIDYLKQTATQKQWQVTIADLNLAAVQAKVGDHARVKAVGVSINDATARQALILQADVVISLLPPALHYTVALDCLAFGKHLLTASYVDDKIRALAAEIKEKQILFLCEMGLDPGIDHMSAMQLIHRIKAKGGRIESFFSHCGGLVAPESDTNPWHYKISWNPRNVVLAGKAGAIYKEDTAVQRRTYEQVFTGCGEVNIQGLGTLAYYPNRDSLSYIPTYGLENTATFKRTTLRYPDFCTGWKQLIDLGLTDETDSVATDGLSIAEFLQQRCRDRKIRFEAMTPLLQEQFLFLGWNDDTLINKGHCCSADVLQFILEKQWVLLPGDKDLVVMLHELGYEMDGAHYQVSSSLVVTGEDHIRTAMAKTVGLPLGIAATLLLEGQIRETGLHIPIIPAIYEPVLQKLQEQGIVFHETAGGK
ncbi:MAG: saccharopine dehydrogenase NADP-binding domain-containing protein [Bacteroidetes bacterium]|nr:saccharopine dehydrogenase NADP-binding domain-containing protein [Bacteroidota bacterium]